MVSKSGEGLPPDHTGYMEGQHVGLCPIFNVMSTIGLPISCAMNGSRLLSEQQTLEADKLIAEMTPEMAASIAKDLLATQSTQHTPKCPDRYVFGHRATDAKSPSESETHMEDERAKSVAVMLKDSLRGLRKEAAAEQNVATSACAVNGTGSGHIRMKTTPVVSTPQRSMAYAPSASPSSSATERKSFSRRRRPPMEADVVDSPGPRAMEIVENDSEWTRQFHADVSSIRERKRAAENAKEEQAERLRTELQSLPHSATEDEILQCSVFKPISLHFEAVFETENKTTVLDAVVMRDLVTEMESLVEMDLLHRLPHGLLHRLLVLCDGHLESAADPVTLRDLPYANQSAQLAVPLQCACGALTVMAGKHTPAALCIEDFIERIIKFIKQVVKELLFPAHDSEYVSNSNTPAKKSEGTPRRKKAPTAANRTALSMIQGLACNAVRLMAKLVQHNNIGDTMIYTCTLLMTESIFVENLPELQSNFSELGHQICVKHKHHHETIILEIINHARDMSPRKLRSTTRSIAGAGSQSIRYITAAIVKILHSMTMAVTDNEPGAAACASTRMEAENTTDVEDTLVREPIRSAMTSAVTSAHTLAVKVLEQVADKEFGAAYKLFVEMMVTDCLKCWNHPGWGAAELLLWRLVMVMHTKLATGAGQNEATKGFAVQMFGTIYAETCEASQTLPELLVGLETTARDWSKEKLAKMCNSDAKVDDDAAESHLVGIKLVADYLECTTVLNTERIPDRNFFLAQAITYAEGEVQKSIEEANRRGGEEGGDVSRVRQQSAFMVQDAVLRSVCELLSGAGASNGGVDGAEGTDASSLFTGNLVGRDAIVKINHGLQMSRPLMRFRRNMVYMIASVFNDAENSHATRSTAMKQLTKIVKQDSKTLEDAKLQNMIATRMHDTSIQMREATVDLVGNFLKDGRVEDHSQYLQMVLGRLRDKGVSVRKRVIKTLREVCRLEGTSKAVVDDVTSRILHMIRERNSEVIPQLVIKTFDGMWFMAEDALVMTLRLEEDEPLDSTLLTKVDCDKIATTIVGLTVRSTTNADNLELLLRHMLLKSELDGTQTQGKQTKRKLRRRRCIMSELVDNLVNRLLSTDTVVGTTQEMLEREERLLHILRVIDLVAGIAPELMASSHTFTFAAYLDRVTPLEPTTTTTTPAAIAEARTLRKLQQEIVRLASRIIRLCMFTIKMPESRGVQHVINSCYQNALKGDFTVVVEAIPCFCISNIKGRTPGNVFMLFNSFWKCLSESQNGATASTPVVARSLMSVGLIYKHFDLGSPTYQGARKKVFPADMDFKKAVVERLLAVATDPTVGPVIRCQALSGIGHVAGRYSDVLLQGQVIALLKNILELPKINENIKLQVRCIVVLATFLKDEEARMIDSDKMLQSNASDGSQKKVVISVTDNEHDATNADMGTSSAVMQLLIGSIVPFLFHSEKSVRTRTMALVTQVVDQGHVHPKECIPALVCSEMNQKDRDLQAQASFRLGQVAEKQMSLLLANFEKGLELYHEMCTQGTTASVSALLTTQVANEERATVLDSLYRRVCKKRQSRIDFMRRILNFFGRLKGNMAVAAASGTPNRPGKSPLQARRRMNTERKKVSSDYVRMLGEVVAYLPYQTMEEVYFVLAHINEEYLSTPCATLVGAYEDLLGLTNNPNNDLDMHHKDGILAMLRGGGKAAMFIDITKAAWPILILTRVEAFLTEFYRVDSKKYEAFVRKESGGAEKRQAKRERVQPLQLPSSCAASNIDAGGATNDHGVRLGPVVDQYLQFMRLKEKMDAMTEMALDSESENDEKAAAMRKARRRSAPVAGMGGVAQKLAGKRRSVGGGDVLMQRKSKRRRRGGESEDVAEGGASMGAEEAADILTLQHVDAAEAKKSHVTPGGRRRRSSKVHLSLKSRGPAGSGGE